MRGEGCNPIQDGKDGELFFEDRVHLGAIEDRFRLLLVRNSGWKSVESNEATQWRLYPGIQQTALPSGTRLSGAVQSSFGSKG